MTRLGSSPSLPLSAHPRGSRHIGSSRLEHGRAIGRAAKRPGPRIRGDERNGWGVHASLFAACALSACAPILQPSAFTGTRPAIDPLVIFAGRTTSQGVLEAASGAPSQRFRVQGVGRVGPDGELVLDQRVAFEGEPARERTWRLRRVDAHCFTGTLTDAAGPVTAEAYGDLIHLSFRLKTVPLGAMEQWLYLQDDGRTLLNEGVVRIGGVTIRRLSERITNLDLPPAPSTR